MISVHQIPKSLGTRKINKSEEKTCRHKEKRIFFYSQVLYLEESNTV